MTIMMARWFADQWQRNEIRYVSTEKSKRDERESHREPSAASPSALDEGVLVVPSSIPNSSSSSFIVNTSATLSPIFRGCTLNGD
jgi:hypothetical protein